MRRLTSAMRVLMTTDAVGGVWRYALDASRALKVRGVHVELVGIGPRPSDDRRGEAAAAGVPLFWLDEALDWTAGGYDALHRTGRAMDALVRDHCPDVVHLNSPALVPFLEGCAPRVATAHSCLATWWRAVKNGPLPADWLWHYEITSVGLATAEVVTAPSRAFANALLETYGGLPNLHVVHNGAAPVEPMPKGTYVLSAGRWWDEGKNLPVLDAAARDIRWPVHVAGPMEGPGCRAAEAQSVEWLGDLPHAVLCQRTAKAPIFVSPSLYEPFGLAVLEAASAQAALVLADIPTFRELWGRCALFVDPTDPAGVAIAVNELIEDAGLRGRLARAARTRARSYSLESQAEALVGAYASIGEPAVAV